MIFWINSIQYLGLSFHDHSHPTMCSLIREKPEWKSGKFSVQVWDCGCETRPLDWHRQHCAGGNTRYKEFHRGFWHCQALGSCIWLMKFRILSPTQINVIFFSLVLVLPSSINQEIHGAAYSSHKDFSSQTCSSEEKKKFQENSQSLLQRLNENAFISDLSSADN